MRVSGRFGVVNGRYRSLTSPDGEASTIIELFGRTDTARSVCVLITGIKPTFEVAPFSALDDPQTIPEELQQRVEQLKLLEHVVGVTGPVVKWTELGFRPVWRLEVTQPFHVPQLRKTIEQQAWRIFSGDIPIVNRLFLDLDLGMHVAYEGDLIFARGADPEFNFSLASDYGLKAPYNVDEMIVCTLENVHASEAFSTPFKVFSFDLETSIEHETILCAAAWSEDLGTGQRTSFEFQGDETEILKHLTKVIQQEDPDIITGYNIDNFDLPRIHDRVQALTKSNEWSIQSQLFGWGRVNNDEDEVKRQRHTFIPKRQSNRSWNLAGRCVMDAWWQARQALNPKRETLSFVAKLLFPDDVDKHKIELDASKMDEEWATRPSMVMEYCVKDAELPLDILTSIQAIRRKEAVATVAKVVLDTASNGSTSQLIDSLVIRLADSLNVAVPLTGSAEAKEGQITGGYVHDVEAGLHPWIAVLDFKSMYPSIMIGHNICYTTRIDPAQRSPPSEQFPPYVAPTQAKFRHQDERKGMVPQLLENLMSQRDEHKVALNLARHENDERKESFHDAMQYAVKILMNSFYGVFASGFYRFTHKDLGASITAWARQNIKGIIQQLEEEGHSVVYSDTDSIFVKSPVHPNSPTSKLDDQTGQSAHNEAYERALNEMVDFGQSIAERYSRDSAVLEFERGLSIFFSHGAKKRYIGSVVWPEESMLVRGYETQRSDSFSYLTDSMNQVFKYVLNQDDKALIHYSVERVQALKRKEVPASELILAKSCKGRVKATPVKSEDDVDFSRDYANPNSMAQVRIAKQRINLGLGFTSGMKVSYVVVDAQTKSRPMQVQAWIESEEDGGITDYDGQFYADRLAAALGRITEVFGWEDLHLVQGSRPSTLFEFS